MSNLESFLLTFNDPNSLLNTLLMKNRYPRLSLLAISFFFSFSLSAQTFTGTLSLVDASGNSVSNYAAGSSLYVNVSDADRNVSATAADTVTVSVSSAKETTAETVVLTETGVNTGVFSASMSFDPTGAVAADGSLQVDAGDMLTVNYTDPADDFGNSKLISATSFYGMTSITSGFIMSNTTWTKANSPYFLTGDVIIPDSVTLTIEPGAVIRFDGSDDLSQERIKTGLRFVFLENLRRMVMRQTRYPLFQMHKLQQQETGMVLFLMMQQHQSSRRAIRAIGIR
jgi:hypothetical protein